MSGPLSRRTALALALLLGPLAAHQMAAAQTPAGQTAPAPQMGMPPSSTPGPASVLLGGQLGKPGPLTLTEVRAMPARTVTVSYRVSGQTVTHTYRGAALYDLLLAAAPQFGPAKNEALRWYVRASGDDGYAAVFGWGELDPGFGNRGVLVAYEEDGHPLGLQDGPLRLIVPGDVKGGRNVGRLSRVQVLPTAP